MIKWTYEKYNSCIFTHTLSTLIMKKKKKTSQLLIFLSSFLSWCIFLLIEVVIESVEKVHLYFEYVKDYSLMCRISPLS